MIRRKKTNTGIYQTVSASATGADVSQSLAEIFFGGEFPGTEPGKPVGLLDVLLDTHERESKALLEFVGARTPMYALPKRKPADLDAVVWNMAHEAAAALLLIVDVRACLASGDTRGVAWQAYQLGKTVERWSTRPHEPAVVEVKTHRAGSAAGTTTIRAAKAAKQKRLLPLVRAAMRNRGFYKACAKVAREEAAAGRKVSARTVERICAAAKETRQ